MKKHTAKNHSRQFRRQRRRERKKHRRVERLAGHRANVLSPSSKPATFEEFLAQAARLARPGDRLHIVYASRVVGQAFGIDDPGNSLHPVSAALIRGEDAPS